MSTFRERLMMVMEELNIKPADLSKGSGLTPSAISKILSDTRRKIHADTAFRIAGYLSKYNIDSSWLYGLKDERVPTKQENIENTFQQLSEDGKNKVIEYARFILESENKNK